jgi:hypothetical protein
MMVLLVQELEAFSGGVYRFDGLSARFRECKNGQSGNNFGSICLFKGKIIWAIALPMAASNAFGGWLGAKLAITKGTLSEYFSGSCCCNLSSVCFTMYSSIKISFGTN